MAGSFNDYIGKRDFRLTLGVAEIFAAGTACPVFRVSVLGASDGFRFRLSQLVTGSLNDRIGKRDFRLTLGVTEMLTTGFASPILRIAVLGTGSGFRLGLGHLVAGCLDDRIGKRDFRLTFGVAEILVAYIAVPIFDVSVLGTGSGFRFGFS